jgi:peroxiredoxin
MPSRPPAAAALAVAALAVFTVWITWRAKALEISFLSRDRSGEMMNKPAPDFTLPALDGRSVSLAAYRGQKKVVVSFWASWCGPCRMETPMLRSLYQRAHKPDSDFELLSVSIDDDRAAAQAYASEAKMPFPVLLDSTQKTAAAWRVEGIPTVFVIDKSGKVTHAHTGAEPGIDMVLAHELGIENYSPSIGAPHAVGSH